MTIKKYNFSYLIETRKVTRNPILSFDAFQLLFLLSSRFLLYTFPSVHKISSSLFVYLFSSLSFILRNHIRIIVSLLQWYFFLFLFFISLPRFQFDRNILDFNRSFQEVHISCQNYLKANLSDFLLLTIDGSQAFHQNPQPWRTSGDFFYRRFLLPSFDEPTFFLNPNLIVPFIFQYFNEYLNFFIKIFVKNVMKQVYLTLFNLFMGFIIKYITFNILQILSLVVVRWRKS